MPKFSIVIPVYNRARYLKEALESVFAQSFKDYEVIVINDGSTDDSEAVVKSFGPAVRYEAQPNQGRSAARNAGIRLAKGEWIAFLDSDDKWLPDKLERQARYIAENADVAMVHGHVDVIGKDGNELPKLNQYLRDLWTKSNRRPNSYEEWTLECRCLLSTVAIRTDCFKKVGLFDVKFAANEDLDLFLRMAASYKIGFLHGSSLAYYRVHEENSGNENLSVGHIQVAEKHLEYLENPKFPANHKPAIRNLYLELSRNHLMLNQNAVGREYFRRAVKMDSSCLFIQPYLRFYLFSFIPLFLREAFRRDRQHYFPKKYDFQDPNRHRRH